ncbi:MAG: ATP-dependent sacrificial sulfur transferase LarE [Dictyoglomus sp.]
MKEKLEELKNFLRDCKKVVVAYSGGVDSTFLLKVAKDTLGDNVLAVTLISPIFPEREIKEAKRIAEELGVRHIILKNDELLKHEEFIKNPPERCYICKKYNFQKIIEVAKENNIDCVLDGSNVDDLKDYRPGKMALKELGILSPLLELGFSKEEIRRLSREFNLPTSEKPSLACLATRIPYGERIEIERLKRIEEGEDYLTKLGFNQVRVRDYKNMARIEIEEENFSLILKKDIREKIIRKLKEMGYKYITLDLEGYRTGSMNQEIKK